jgi:ribosomal-protein-alanine N-acetyltransferase
MGSEPTMLLRDMTLVDVDEVQRIEMQVHSHPWTRGNFTDSLASGYICKVYAVANEIVGYAVMMPALDEVQLLDIGIAKTMQRTGLGKKLLQDMLMLARNQKFIRMLLEVRSSNVAAIALYRKVGFTDIGLRRGYYPAAHGREDAIVMEYKLE